MPGIAGEALKAIARSNSAEQNQDQKNNNHKAKAATAIVAGAVESTAPNPAEASKQDDD
jgi:hypothetical protein